MSRLNEWLADGLMISDGAWGTQLQARGLSSGTTPDTWNLTHADQVESVARAYVEAGSQVILTNTFRANAIAMPGATWPNLTRSIAPALRFQSGQQASRRWSLLPSAQREKS